MELPKEIKEQFIQSGTDGGNITKARYGLEHYRIIGKKGGKMSGRSKRRKISTALKSQEKSDSGVGDKVSI